MINLSTELKEKFWQFLKQQTVELDISSTLHIINLGDNLASQKYIEIKKKLGEELGIIVQVHNFPLDVSPDELNLIIEKVHKEKSGLIFQLPVPENYYAKVIQTPVYSDVDLLGLHNTILWSEGFLPPTIGAIDLVLKDIISQSDRHNLENDFADIIKTNLDLAGKTVAVVGQGKLVGTPLLQYLKDRNATILSLNKFSYNIRDMCKQADIIICAAGVPGLLTKDYCKPGAIVIDAATSESNGTLVGDVDLTSFTDSAQVTISPSPGGIGKITVMYLFYNLRKLHQLHQ